MANLRVTIVKRIVLNGRRKFVPVPKNSGPADYYVRWCVGSKPVCVKAGTTWDEAELAQLKQERRLKAAAIGALIPEEAPAPGAHPISVTVTAYLEALREERRPTKTIKSKETELRDFARRCRKQYVEEITRKDLIAFRNELTDGGYADNTVLNRMMTVVTWLKKNPLHRVTGLLEKADWPDKPQTEPNPAAVASPDAEALSDRRRNKRAIS